ncbi:MAG: helix-turn-helix transcriptional regulator [Dehalococcoidia bacterium]
MSLYGYGFADRLAKLLEQHNVSCYKIAEFTHLDQSYLSRLRSGDKHPSPETLVKISLALVKYGADIRLPDIESLFQACGRSLNIKDL